MDLRKKYNGEWKNDYYHRKGTLVFDDGEFYFDLKQGKITYYFSNREKYIGDWGNNKINGEGTIYYNKNDDNKRNYYKGGWKNEEKYGKGILVWQDGEKYEGNFNIRGINGKGTFYYKKEVNTQAILQMEMKKDME